ncbi:hypothetical protein T12_3329 [Trichinella patagoniensis]|uniref:Uncharacterized protein n=1 Tax=Trichinella patagoniensis TaxID=990121 RepID=A0A0V0Z342_9BILA|nr:hypothetical protein T12_3329 [Trichinella patagoniensis]
MDTEIDSVIINTGVSGSTLMKQEKDNEIFKHSASKAAPMM